MSARVLARTLARHRIVIASLERAKTGCAETLRLYREEEAALAHACALVAVHDCTTGTR